MRTTIFIQGVTGRMGKAVCAALEKDPSFSLNTLETADVVIDFSAPTALHDLLARCSQNQKPLVIGTTGHPGDAHEIIAHAAQKIPILFSPNLSLGMAVCIEAARLIKNLLGPCNIEIIEAHHVHKKDQPSGTALALKKVLGPIRIHSIRAGDIPGDHTVLFALDGERIELKHQVHSREAFARGALVAAKFLKNKPPGLYSLKDIYETRQS